MDEKRRSNYTIETKISTFFVGEILLLLTAVAQITENFHFQEEDPETLGELTGNRGKSCGSESLGVLLGEGCK